LGDRQPRREPGNVETVTSTTVEVHASGALPLVARATDSATWQGRVTLGELWASLPELRYFVLDPATTPVLKLELDQTWSGHEYLPGPPHAYGSVRAGIRVNAAHDDSDATLRALNDTLEPYPVTAAAWVWQGSTPLVNGTSIAWVAWTKPEAGKSLIPVATRSVSRASV
jgi:hypothetical protein